MKNILKSLQNPSILIHNPGNPEILKIMVQTTER